MKKLIFVFIKGLHREHKTEIMWEVEIKVSQ